MDLFEDELIECVHDYPLLYRSKDKSHKSIIIRENCWREIARKMKKTPRECKKKWRNIRDSYRKNQNKKKTGGAASVSKYDDERLKFIDETFAERETIPNIATRTTLSLASPQSPLDSPTSKLVISVLPPISPTLSHSSPPLLEPCVVGNVANLNRPQTKKKEKDAFLGEFKKNSEERNEVLQSSSVLANSNTPVHTFFSSMADVVCTFPAEKIAQIRLNICKMVTETELFVLAQQQTPAP